MKKLFASTLLLVLAMTSYQAKAAMWLVGNAFNGWAESDNVEMTQESEGIYSWQGDLTAGMYFAFFKDNQSYSSQRGPTQNEAAPTGDWEETTAGGAWKLETSGTYLIEYNYNNDQARISLQQEPPFDPTQRKFAVTGDAFGGWNMPPTSEQTFTNNGDGTYTLVYQDAVPGGFKLSDVGMNDVFDTLWAVFNSGVMGAANLVVGDNTLSTSFGSGDMYFPCTGNVTLTISDVTETSCKLKIEGTVVEQTYTYTIVGAPELMGANWDLNAEANEMTKMEDGTYVLVKENVELEANTTGYAYKVVRDHSWNWSVPQGATNQYLPISTHGVYDVKFTLTLGDNPTLEAQAVLKQEILPDYILHYGVIGQDWQDVTFVAGEGDNANIYTATAQFAQDTEFGIKYGDTWYAGLVTEGNNYPITYDNCTGIVLNSGENTKNFHINEVGNYTFILTVTDQGITMDVQGLQAPNYVLHYGNDNNGWQDKDFAAGDGEFAGKLIAKEVEFAQDTEFVINYGNIVYAGMPNGDEPHYWIHDTWCSNIPLSTAEGIKHFIINEEGTYSFVLTLNEDGQPVKMDVLGFPAPAVRGDLDGDGSVDVHDLNMMINMILGKIDKILETADLDGNGDVDVSDVNLEINIILGKSSE